MIRPGGEIGNHPRFKTWRLRACRFEPCPGHVNVSAPPTPKTGRRGHRLFDNRITTNVLPAPRAHCAARATAPSSSGLRMLALQAGDAGSNPAGAAFWSMVRSPLSVAGSLVRWSVARMSQLTHDQGPNHGPRATDHGRLLGEVAEPGLSRHGANVEGPMRATRVFAKIPPSPHSKERGQGAQGSRGQGDRSWTLQTIIASARASGQRINFPTRHLPTFVVAARWSSAGLKTRR